jgi:hypothetical protein
MFCVQRDQTQPVQVGCGGNQAIREPASVRCAVIPGKEAPALCDSGGEIGEIGVSHLLLGEIGVSHLLLIFLRKADVWPQRGRVAFFDFFMRYRKEGRKAEM